MPALNGHEAQALTVSAVAKFLYQVIAQNIAPLWIKGEVSNLKIQPNGNTYFSIKDSESKLNAIIMANSPARKFIPDLKNGLEILILGKISYYKKEGSISVFIENIEFLGQGLLKQKFDELKKKLEAEGFFDPAGKRKIPEYPRCVGVVTSPTGAAFQDILNVMKRRLPIVDLVLFPAAVQGDAGAREIADAIHIANRFGKGVIDVLIVGRGGGSIEDLWCFNEEIVARAIHKSSIPVISAVGHEIDYTISDYTADYRAPTPSAAAEIVVKDRDEIKRYVDGMTFKMEKLLENRLIVSRKTLEMKGKDYFQKTLKYLMNDLSISLDRIKIRLSSNYSNYLQKLRSGVELLTEKLMTLGPQGILKRGYSLTYLIGEDGSKNAVSSVSGIKKGESLETLLSDGTIKSIVKDASK